MENLKEILATGALSGLFVWLIFTLLQGVTDKDKTHDSFCVIAFIGVVLSVLSALALLLTLIWS